MFLPCKTKTNGEEGFSLLTIVVGLGVLAIVAQTAVSSASNVFTAAKYVAVQNEKTDLENYIKVRTNCTESIARHANHPATLFDRKGNPIGPTEPQTGVMKVKNWKVKVVGYNAGTKTFTIHASNPQAQKKSEMKIFTKTPFTCS